MSRLQWATLSPAPFGVRFRLCREGARGRHAPQSLESIQFVITARNMEPFRLIDEASAANLEPWHVINPACALVMGKTIDVEESNVR